MKTSHLALIAFAFLQPVPPKTLRLRPRESRHQTKHSTWGSFHLPAMPLRLAQARLHPPPCPLIDSSPFASSPSSPPASRPPASLPQLVSRSGCLHLPRASPRPEACFCAKVDSQKWREGPVPAAHARRAVLPFRLDLWAMESIASCRRSRRGGMRGVHACRDAGDYVCLGACWM